MEKHMILYRGSLKSCNYRCSYCPFSKHPMSERELRKDREQWEAFVQGYQEKAEGLMLGALMVVPYGEAMIHPWYPVGLAHISRLLETDAVGAQTNLSFSVKEFLTCYQKAGGEVSKLRFWATYHPEMAEVEEFAEKCRELRSAGVSICAGCVGVPENQEILKELRRKLPKDVYLWINKMDGLRRAYTKEEIEVFLSIDPYFKEELALMPADASMCQGRLFVEGDGRMRICNIGMVLEKRWEELGREIDGVTTAENFPEPKCGRKYCTCYLAYAGRKDFREKGLFGIYPLFRIPGNNWIK